jgi:hypothetical protein
MALIPVITPVDCAKRAQLNTLERNKELTDFMIATRGRWISVQETNAVIGIYATEILCDDP